MFMNIRQNIQNVASGRTESILPHMLNMPVLTIVPYGCVTKCKRESEGTHVGLVVEKNLNSIQRYDMKHKHKWDIFCMFRSFWVMLPHGINLYSCLTCLYKQYPMLNFHSNYPCLCKHLK